MSVNFGELPEMAAGKSVDTRYRSLLELSECAVPNEDLSATFHNLLKCLPEVVEFDSLALILNASQNDNDSVHALRASKFGEIGGLKLQADEMPLVIEWRGTEPRILNGPEFGGYAQLLQFRDTEPIQSCVTIPLTASRQLLGAMVLGSRLTDMYKDSDLEFLELVGKQVATALDKCLAHQKSRSLQEQLIHERDRLQLLLDVGNAVVSKLEVRPLFEAISVSLRKVMECDFASLAFPDRDPRYLRFTVIDDSGGGHFLKEDTRLPVRGSASGYVFRTGKHLVLNNFEDVRPDPEIYGNEDGRIFYKRLAADGFKSGCFLPLHGRDRVIGALALTKRVVHGFAQADVDLLRRVAVQIAIAVENALAYKNIDELKEKIEGEKLYLEDEIRNEYFDDIVGESTKLMKVLDQVRTVAVTDSTVLILGETGTGKELIARAIHNTSYRQKKTFVKLNCSAIPTGLLESELFGHEKGAFTGAIAQRIGRMELADGGTLFLDEIGDIPPELQPKLLRALQEREFERLGSTRTIQSDVRLIAATHRDLSQMVERRQFRSDLFYRLNVFPIKLPPLRERPDDIPRLARHFVSKHAQRMTRKIETITDETMKALIEWPWPGNVRELENLIERAVILSRGPILNVPTRELRDTTTSDSISSSKESKEQPRTLDESKREHILKVLRETKGVLGGPNGAAARLGLKRTTLQAKMNKLGITRNDW